MAVVDGAWDPIHGLTKSETAIDSISYQLEKGIKKTNTKMQEISKSQLWCPIQSPPELSLIKCKMHPTAREHTSSSSTKVASSHAKLKGNKIPQR